MKKFCSVLLALFLPCVLSAAQADGTVCQVVSMPDVSMEFYVPDDMASYPPNASEGQVYCGGNDDLSLVVTAMKTDAETLEDVSDTLSGEGYVTSENVNTGDDLPYDCVSATSGGQTAVYYLGDSGWVYGFSCVDLSGNGTAVFSDILGTLSLAK